MKTIKFEVYHNGELIGYERIGADGNWEWMVPSLNPEHKELWTTGVMNFDWTNKGLERRQIFPVDEIMALIKESFDDNISSSAAESALGLESYIDGKEDFYVDLKKKLVNL
jgi:hypothetical protein